MKQQTYLLLCLALLLPTERAAALFNSSGGNPSIKNETEKSVAKKIKKGKTTRDQVKAAYGSPMHTYFTDSGNEVWTYYFVQQRDNAMNYIPYANKLESGTKGTRKELKIFFKDDGVVKNYSMHESKTETKSGLLK